MAFFERAEALQLAVPNMKTLDALTDMERQLLENPDRTELSQYQRIGMTNPSASSSTDARARTVTAWMLRSWGDVSV